MARSNSAATIRKLLSGAKKQPASYPANAATENRVKHFAGPTDVGAATHQVQNLGLFRLCLAALVVVQHYQKLIFGEPSGQWIEAL